MKKGIDVARWQGEVAWGKVKDEGVSFAILKVINKSGDTESSFERNYKETLKVEMPVGVYNYSYASTVERAKSDAKKVIEILKGRDLTYGVWLDIENEVQKDIGMLLAEMINAYQKIIVEEGYSFGVYTGLSFYNSYIKKYASEIECPFWIARYPSNSRKDISFYPNESKKPEICHELFAWQYSSKGIIFGIVGNVDLNLMYESEIHVKENSSDKNDQVNPYQEPKYTLYKARLFQSKEYVKWLQFELKITIDGIFGNQTKMAVLNFQKTNGLVQDGKVGPKTRGVLGEYSKNRIL